MTAYEQLPHIDVTNTVERIRAALQNRCLWRGDGKYSALFEARFAKKCNREYAVLTTNGSHAIEAAIATLPYEPGHEIILPAIAFIAVAGSILQRGYVPVPVDVRPGSLNMDPDCVQAAITAKTRAIMAVHFAGAPCDMEGLQRVCLEDKITLIEDAAQAHFAMFDGHPVGSFGELACFSFQAAKTMTAGEGGIVVTGDVVAKDYIEAFVNYGRSPLDNGYDHRFLSSNYRLSDLSAAVLLGQLDTIVAENAFRQLRFQRFKSLIGTQTSVRFQVQEAKTTSHSHSLIPVILPEFTNKEMRDAIVKEMRDRGWPVRQGYPLLSQTKVLSSAVFRGLLTESQKARIETADTACRCASGIVDRLIVFHHSVLYRSDDDVEDLSVELAKSIKKNSTGCV